MVLAGGRGGWTCAISCPVANGTRRFRTFEMGWFCPLVVDHAAVWKKGGVGSVSFCDVDGWLSWKVRGNELMGVLWVKRIILGGSFDPSSSFFLFQKVSRIWGMITQMVIIYLIKNSRIGKFFFLIWIKEWLAKNCKIIYFENWW